MAGTIVYVSAEGILSPLGYSQVYRVVEGLGRRGARYAIASLERRADLDRAGALEARLEQAGVRWYRAAYDESGSARAAALNIASLTRLALKAAVTQRASLVHARAYHGALVAVAVQAATGVPYLFDARSYWIDERLDDGRWFSTPRALAAARALERRFFAGAQAVVCLTELQASDVRAGKLGPWSGRPVLTIPTCADFDEFTLRNGPGAAVPASLAQKLQGKLVLGIIGSINASYRMEESFALAHRVLALRPDAHLLVLGAQALEYEALRARHAIEPSRYTHTRAPHHAMAEWLPLISWGVLLLASPHAKRASIPTKLAEFFAAGVRPVQHGCNEEVSAWVRRAGSGHVLDALDAASLDAAARHLAASKAEPRLLARARELAAPHFSLASGLDRYERLLRTVAPRAFG